MVAMDLGNNIDELFDFIKEYDFKLYKYLEIDNFRHLLNKSTYCERCGYLLNELKEALENYKLDAMRESNGVKASTIKFLKAKITDVLIHLRDDHNQRIRNYYKKKFFILSVIGSLCFSIWFLDNLLFFIAFNISCVFIFTMIGHLIDKKKNEGK